MSHLATRRHRIGGAPGLLLLPARAAAQAASPATPTGNSLARERFTRVAPFPPGGPIDSLARTMADGLGRKHGPPAVRESLTAQGLTASTMAPAAFGARIREEAATCAGIIPVRKIVVR